MKLALSLVAIGLLLQGCGGAPPQISDRRDYVAEATRTYPGETKERVIEAAQLILKQSDPNDFQFQHYSYGFTGKRHYMIYVVLAASTGFETWNFSVEDNGKAQVASLAVSDSGSVTTNCRFPPRFDPGFPLRSDPA